MSIEAYENQIGRMKIRDEILRGKSQSDSGAVLNGKEVMTKLKEKYVK